MNHTVEQPVASIAPKRLRWKRYLRRAAIVFSIVAVCVAFLLKDHIRTLASLRRIPGTKAYVMDYYVDYHIDEVRTHGIDVNHIEDSLLKVYCAKWIQPIAARVKRAFLKESIATVEAGEHCSTVVLHTKQGHVYFGRNLDYKHDSCLILKVHGPSGVSSVSVLDLHYLNLDRDDLDQTNLIQRIPLLFAPYYLQDGMNRYGVAVSDMSLAGSRPPYDPSRPDIIHSTAMRLILDYAHTTDEAVELLKQYNIRFVAERSHLMIADATGKSTVVEFIDGEIKLAPGEQTWQICTNHQLCGKSVIENCTACKRYTLASSELTSLHGSGNANDVMKIMKSVSKPNWTMWSSVYDLTTHDFHFAYRQHYENQYVEALNTVP